ncbi:MAG: hypothetical protein F4056_07180 [Chloroflexi bacterium]|nr:hypothetical protein [Chloroflexota bacterium]
MAEGEIIEVKRKLDGSEERFTTELVHRSPSLLLVLYRIERGENSLDSYGCFWRRRPYGCYHIVRPPGAPDAGREVLSRFDVLRDVAIEGDEVRYLDLLLDLVVRVDAAGRIRTRWEDEHEVEAALASGLLDAAGGAYVARARRTLGRRHRRVVGEIRALLRRLGRIE